VEAESEEQAFELARDMDGGDFTDSRDCHDWHINDIEELENYRIEIDDISHINEMEA
jgi:hypothetical protein